MKNILIALAIIFLLFIGVGYVLLSEVEADGADLLVANREEKRLALDKAMEVFYGCKAYVDKAVAEYEEAVEFINLYQKGL